MTVFRLLGKHETRGASPHFRVERGRIRALDACFQIHERGSLMDGELFPPELDVAAWQDGRWTLAEGEDWEWLIGLIWDELQGRDPEGSSSSTSADDTGSPPVGAAGAGWDVIDDYLPDEAMVLGRWTDEQDFEFEVCLRGGDPSAVDHEWECNTGHLVVRGRDLATAKRALEVAIPGYLRQLREADVLTPGEFDEAAQRISLEVQDEDWDEWPDDHDPDDDPFECGQCGKPFAAGDDVALLDPVTLEPRADPDPDVLWLHPECVVPYEESRYALMGEVFGAGPP